MKRSTSAVGDLRKRMIMVCACAVLLLVGGAFASAQGTTVTKWTQGDRGSPLMHPGMSCIDCHAKGEGPRFLIAGTVFKSLTEADNVYGVEGVTVQITDAKGNVFKLTTNASGNFYLQARGNTLVMPFTAKVISNGKERAMGSAQSTGSCNTCHAAKGLNGAPGRILIPQT
jgi:hypothetical protein